MASREIRHLSPAMQVMFNKMHDRVRRDPWFQRAGVSMLLICTHRSNEEQAELFAQGRTKPGRIVTRAKPGKSAHNAETPQGEPAAEAFDVAMLRNGKITWGTSGDGIDEDPGDDLRDDLEAWQRLGEHGKAVGLRWYGDPDAAFREFPHFQNPDWVRP
jgi:peptidoglycan L-alanyl-D-glutamate endopeptidase CwlK